MLINLTPRRMALQALVSAAALLSAPMAAHSQSFPSRSINMVVPYAAGGSSDFVARLLAQKLGEHFGQSVVVENRAGAGATIGTGHAARKDQQGYVALLADNAQTTAPALYTSLNYDSVNDFTVVGFVARASAMLFARSNLGIDNLPALIERSKKAPGSITIGTGHGSPSHLITEYFQLKAGIKLTVVPYKGAALAFNDLLAGHIDLIFTNPASAAPHLKTGRILPLAQSGDQRDPRFPNVPTFKESKVEGFDANYWFALLVPADTPADALASWRKALSAVLAQADVQERFASAGLNPFNVSPEQARQMLQEEVQRWTAVAKEAGIQTN